jgi:L,D-transpeptidase catalytic domain
MLAMFALQWFPLESPLVLPPAPLATSTPALPAPPAIAQRTYIEIIGGCGPYFQGECVSARSGPGKQYAARKALRNGMVFETSGVVERDGTRWYRIVFSEWIRYPDRLRGPLYVSADFVRVYTLDEPTDASSGTIQATSSKYILVDKSDQMLYAYDGDTLFMTQKISTGLSGTPTPMGRFSVYRKTPSRYMQGPLPGVSEQYYDLPGVPWNLYFTQQGAVIHGAYWHDNFGRPWSHGCVNVPMDQARLLYEWAPVGTPVVVRY